MANRNARRARKRDKIRTAKLLDKITYNPLVHKQKVKRKLRQELQARLVDSRADTQDYQCYRNMKFGSINVNGLEIDSNWAIRNIIDQRGFDVGSSFDYIIEHFDDITIKGIIRSNKVLVSDNHIRIIDSIYNTMRGMANSYMIELTIYFPDMLSPTNSDI